MCRYIERGVRTWLDPPMGVLESYSSFSLFIHHTRESCSFSWATKLKLLLICDFEGTETLDVENRKFEAEAMAMVEDLISKGSKIESAPLIVAEGDKGDRVAEPSDMKEKVQSFS